jgi:N-acetylmuramoyl-L-alanine amidase
MKQLLLIVGFVMFGSLVQANEMEEIDCLAKNIYFEARSDSLAGQVAVADVTLNRVHSADYPNTICGVVKQGRQDSNGNMIRHQCQFSWYCDGKSDRIPNISTNDAWWAALDLASNMYFNNTYRGITEGCTHYHATYVSPAWARKLQLVGRIGSHVFYRQNQ